MRTDTDSVLISTDSIGLRAIPHRNGAEYVGESKDLWFKYLKSVAESGSIVITVST